MKSISRQAHLLGVALCVLIANVDLKAADWPRFLGPNADSKSEEKGLLDAWPIDGPPLEWKKEVGTGYSAPSIRNGRLILHHRVGNEEIVESMDPRTGKAGWTFKYPSNYIDPFGYNNGPRCTPILTEDRCFVFGAEGKLYCIDIQTGKQIWMRDTAKDFDVPEAFFGVGSSPLIEGDKLIVMVGGQPNSGIVAFDTTSGHTLWESVGKNTWEGERKTGWRGEPFIKWQGYEKQASYASPVAATIHGKRHILCLTRQGLVSLDPATGKEYFHYWFRSTANDSVNAMNPMVSGDTILISAAYYRVGSVLLKVMPDGKSLAEQWRSTALEVHWTTPVLHEGNLYAFSGRNEPDARFRCVEMGTGKLLWDQDERWRKSYQGPPEKYGRGSSILVDDKLIVMGEAGQLGLFYADSTAAKEISKFQVPEMKYPCWTAPVLSNRKLYLRSESRLICYNLSAN
ncbi:MAG: PQQ-binding-like beta-propeller repeat protein [Verrucomicrobia bacterium]|jgi:outer membrane protein assembly factor BamB|nr:PQQ-binding-like beta-propeller repeat protein [Verrucomicrobiota bacterium]